MTTLPPFKVALIGECMVELRESADGILTRGFGGDTFNTAAYMARLGRALGPFVDYVSAVGDDPFSAEMLAFFRQNGVETRHVQVRPGLRPGLYFISVDKQGERRFTYWRGEAAARETFEGVDSDALLAALGGYDLVYVSGISLAVLRPDSRERLLQRLEAIGDQGVRIAFDCNHRPVLWPSVETARAAWQRMFQIANYVLATTEELEILGLGGPQAAIQHLAARPGLELVVKDGEAPCTIASKGRIHRVPADKVCNVVDTTAAGDSFSAAYLLGRLLGLDEQQSARRAHALAAAVISHRGAIIPLDGTPMVFQDQIEVRRTSQVNFSPLM
jgi:2-dehydro-3-deoxygluconokinase